MHRRLGEHEPADQDRAARGRKVDCPCCATRQLRVARRRARARRRRRLCGRNAVQVTHRHARASWTSRSWPASSKRAGEVSYNRFLLKFQLVENGDRTSSRCSPTAGRSSRGPSDAGQGADAVREVRRALTRYDGDGPRSERMSLARAPPASRIATERAPAARDAATAGVSVHGRGVSQADRARRYSSERSRRTHSRLDRRQNGESTRRTPTPSTRSIEGAPTRRATASSACQQPITTVRQRTGTGRRRRDRARRRLQGSAHPGPPDVCHRRRRWPTRRSAKIERQSSRSTPWPRSPVYWIVNLVDRRVEVYTQPRGGKNPAYRTRTDYGPNDAVPVVDCRQAGRRDRGEGVVAVSYRREPRHRSWLGGGGVAAAHEDELIRDRDSARSVGRPVHVVAVPRPRDSPAGRHRPRRTVLPRTTLRPTSSCGSTDSSKRNPRGERRRQRSLDAATRQVRVASHSNTATGRQP